MSEPNSTPATLHSAILDLVKASPAGLPLADLQTALASAGKNARKRLRAALEELKAADQLKESPQGQFRVSGFLRIVTGKLSMHPNGFGFVAGGAGGDVFLSPPQCDGLLHGDTVEVKEVPSRQPGKTEGVLVRIVERASARVVGRYTSHGSTGVVVPDDIRANFEIYIPMGKAGAAQSGQMVIAEITDYPLDRCEDVRGKVVKVLGKKGEPEVDTQTIVVKHGLPYEFPAEVLAAARAIPATVGPTDLTGRVDLRDKLIVTIDGETAKDFDDAITVEPEGANYRLWVSIADVSHYVLPGSAIDVEAYGRGTSVYFPDRCIPMLPEELSNGICSLNPQVDRLVMTAELLFDASGSCLESNFYPAVINSRERLTYTKVKQILEDRDPELCRELAHCVPMLQAAQQLADILSAMRHARGSIDFDLPEPQIVIDATTGSIESIVRAERNLAHRLIEEFMLAANEAVATFVTGREFPFLYRVHDHPDVEKLQDFGALAHGLGYALPMKDAKVRPRDLQQLLVQFAGKPEERMLNELLLRCMKSACYSSENLGHYGLASDCYGHFTSPIRRYPDLIVHRILRGLLTGSLAKSAIPALAEQLALDGPHTSTRERAAVQAEREIVKLKKCEYMAERVGGEFDGFISGVTQNGLFVELAAMFVEGMVAVTSLPAEPWEFNDKTHTLLGKRSKTSFRIGDPCRIKVVGVNRDKRQIDFVFVEQLAVATDAAA